MDSEDLNAILDQHCGAEPIDVETVRWHIFRLSEKLSFIGQCFGDNSFECSGDILSTLRELKHVYGQVVIYEKTRGLAD